MWAATADGNRFILLPVLGRPIWRSAKRRPRKQRTKKNVKREVGKKVSGRLFKSRSVRLVEVETFFSLAGYVGLGGPRISLHAFSRSEKIRPPPMTSKTLVHFLPPAAVLTALSSKASINRLATTEKTGEPIATPSVRFPTEYFFSTQQSDSHGGMLGTTLTDQ